MNLDIVPAHELSLADQSDIFNRAFAGYLAGWSDLDAIALGRLISAQGVDLCHSRFVRADGIPAGFGYVNRTGNVSRVAGMGVVPEARRSGAATVLLSHLLDEAKARGDEAMVLEVFEQNVPALNLYQRHEFHPVMRLFGWRRAPTKNIETRVPGEVGEISLLAANRTRGSLEFPQIPWQISEFAVAKLADAARAFRIDNVCVVISNPAAPPIRIQALLGMNNDHIAAAKAVLAALIDKFSESEFYAREVIPEQFGTEIFQPLGFARESLNQFLMRRDLQ